MAISALSLLLLSLSFPAFSVRVPVVPEFIFYNANGETAAAPHETTELNQTQHNRFRNIMRFATQACFVGVWRMYPLRNYDVDLINGNWGPTFRGNMERQCVDLSPEEHGVVFLNQRSIRALDPDPARNGLSLRSISLFPKEYAAGTAQVIHQNTNDVPITVSVKSFFVTGVHFTPPESVPEAQWTLYEVSAGAPNTSPRKVCLYLSQPDETGNPARLYYSATIDNFPQLSFVSVKALQAPIAMQCSAPELQLPTIQLPPQIAKVRRFNETGSNNPVFGSM